MQTSLVPDSSLSCTVLCLSCVAQVQGNRKGDARAGVTKELLIRLGIGIVHASVSEQCPRSSARIEQRPPEPCVGRSNRLGGTSSQSFNHHCHPSTVLCCSRNVLASPLPPAMLLLLSHVNLVHGVRHL